MATAIIVAAGRGERMQSSVAKQYLGLNGIPVLAITLGIFDQHPGVGRICLVLPPSDTAFCREQILPHLRPRLPISLVSGGEMRQDSVFQGLCELDPSEEIVVIHDGVRPFVTAEQIGACIGGARTTGACILGIPASDTLKRVGASGRIEATVPRQGIWLAQTPQAFKKEVIEAAYARARAENFCGTDDAELVERTGHPVMVVPGSWRNIKITTPADLDVARRLF